MLYLHDERKKKRIEIIGKIKQGNSLNVNQSPSLMSDISQ